VSRTDRVLGWSVVDAAVSPDIGAGDLALASAAGGVSALLVIVYALRRRCIAIVA
jgi:hypothetical protein